LMWLYPVLIAPLFNKFEPIKDEALQDKIMALMDQVDLKAKGIYQVDEGKRSKHTNAYFTGIGKTKRIVLYDTLLTSHTSDEIVSVLAHEIGHWKKKHILKQLSFMIGASLILLYLIYRIVGWPQLYTAFGLSHQPVYAGFFLVSLYLTAAGFFFSPIGAAITRRFEREADRMAFDLTGTSQPMISALKRLAKDNLSNLHPHPWYVKFYYSHPPLIERIEYLQAMDYKNGKH
jgi:STE24 endopeptidase